MTLPLIFLSLILFFSVPLSAKDIIKIGDRVITGEEVKLPNEFLGKICSNYQSLNESQKKEAERKIEILGISAIFSRIYWEKITEKYQTRVLSEKKLSEIKQIWEKSIEERTKSNKAFQAAIQAVESGKMTVESAYRKYLQPDHFCSLKFFASAWKNERALKFLKKTKMPEKFETNHLLISEFENALPAFILKQSGLNSKSINSEQCIKAWHLNELKKFDIEFLDDKYTFPLEELLYPQDDILVRDYKP